MTPIERAARALLRSQDGLPPAKPADWSEEAWEEAKCDQAGIENEQWPDYLDDVRAVLLAIRDPSEAMVKAAASRMLSEATNDARREYDASEGIRAAIDAALAEEGS